MPMTDLMCVPPPPQFLEVRPSICVTGFHREGVQFVKNKIGLLLDTPMALESFHIHRMSDVQDGSLLVPKVVMVAMHCPGKKLIDEDGNEGQLDFLYDEVCDLGGRASSNASYVFRSV